MYHVLFDKGIVWLEPYLTMRKLGNNSIYNNYLAWINSYGWVLLHHKNSLRQPLISISVSTDNSKIHLTRSFCKARYITLFLGMPSKRAFKRSHSNRNVIGFRVKFEAWNLIQNCKMSPVTSSVMQLIVPACALLPVKQQCKKCAAGFH